VSILSLFENANNWQIVQISGHFLVSGTAAQPWFRQKPALPHNCQRISAGTPGGFSSGLRYRFLPN